MAADMRGIVSAGPAHVDIAPAESGRRAETVPTLRNRLLRGLPAAEWETLGACMERVELRPRQVLHHWNMPMRDVYFVEHGLISVSVRISREQAVEAWLIGSEGMTGIPVLLGDDDNPSHRRVVQVGGTAFRIAAGDLMASVRELDTLRETLLRYVQFVLGQTSQWGACNAHHNVRQRTARWLLTARDALESDALPVTHQLLARLLGVRRASVSECLSALEADGVIRNTRSLVEIADAQALSAIACDCHRAVRRAYRHLFDR